MQYTDDYKTSVKKLIYIMLYTTQLFELTKIQHCLDFRVTEDARDE